MCLILFSHHQHPIYRLVLAANRDEFYRRPAAAMHYWREAPQILAGRDLEAGGTWLGITRQGRWSAVTNYRNPRSVMPAAPSRGDLVADYLKQSCTPRDYLIDLQGRSHTYNGFNLLVGTADAVCYHSNRCAGVQSLPPGIYGLSNHLMDTAWPKILKGKKGLAELVGSGGRLEAADFLPLLTDRFQPGDAQLPDTGVGIDWERILAPVYIASGDYGTRCSSILTITYGGEVEFTEFTWQVAAHAGIEPGAAAKLSGCVSHRFTIET